jgi:hypothetical protein
MKEKRPHTINKKEVCWDEGSVRIALGSLRQAFKWAVGRSLLSVNPFLTATSTSASLWSGRRC